MAGEPAFGGTTCPTLPRARRPVSHGACASCQGQLGAGVGNLEPCEIRQVNVVIGVEVQAGAAQSSQSTGGSGQAGGELREISQVHNIVTANIAGAELVCAQCP